MDQKKNKNMTVYQAAYGMIKKIDTMKNEPLKKATLANLRNSINKSLVDSMEAFAFIIENMPEEFLGTRKGLSKEEKAILTSLQLYALHQQGSSESVFLDQGEDRWKNMGYSLGNLRDGEDSKSVDRRFNALITSSSFEEFSHHLRQMVGLLKSKKKSQVKVNYAKLADDLFYFLIGYEERIRLDWSRAYYSFRKKDDDKEKEEAKNEKGE